MVELNQKRKDIRAQERAAYLAGVREGVEQSRFVGLKATLGDLAASRRAVERNLLHPWKGKPGSIVEEGTVTGRIGQLLVEFEDGPKLWLFKSEVKYLA